MALSDGIRISVLDTHTHTHGAEHFLINERYKNEEMESCKKQCLSAC